MGLRLIIEDYEGSTTVFPLGDGAVTIGREEGNTIRLDEKNISRRHLRLVPADAGWMVEDLHSYNGVRVNGEVVDNGSEVHEGDLIQIGDYQLLIGDETSTRATVELGPAVIAAANDFGGGGAAAAGAGAVTFDDSPGARGPVVGPAAVPLDQDWDEPKSSGGGGKVLVALLLLGAIGGGAWYMFGRGAAANEAVASQEPKGAATAATAAAAAASGEAGPTADVETAAQDSEAEPEPEATSEAEPEPEATSDAESESESEAEPELIEPEPEPEPEAEPELIEPEPVATPTKKKKKKKKKKAAAPTQSADELLSAARSAQLSKSYAKAYSLAKQSYAAKASAAAAKVMGVAACKMGDASKAKSAYAKLSGSNKSALKSVCASAGISL